MAGVPTGSRSLWNRRVLLLPAVFLVFLVALPWVLALVENRWFGTRSHLREIVKSGITLLLGAWG
jgi:hypothetical protein